MTMISDVLTSDRAFVWIWLPGLERPVICGRLDVLHPTPRIGFRYARSYLERDDAISIYDRELPLRRGLIEPAAELPAPGCILDAGPDAWGQRIILDRLTGRHGRGADPGQLNVLTYLLAGDSDRIGNLDFTSASEVYTPRQAGPATLDDLRQAAERIEAGDPIPAQLEAALLRGSSIGGARPKALLDDGDRKLIAKFSSTTDTLPVVQAEFVAMTLARRAGINAAHVELASSAGKRVLLVERFDRIAGTGQRRAVVSALTILGLGELLARYASYAELAQVIRERFTRPQATLRELFQRITFNVLVSNVDDHARNHAAFWDGEHLALTPAYDVCPQQRLGYTAEQAMYIGDDRDNFKASVVAGCVERASLYQLDKSDATDIVDHQIATITESWHDACDRAELTSEQRKALWGRQFLNPGSLIGWTDPIEEPRTAASTARGTLNPRT
jgi:serine/threonine-protein kinase HipA